MPHPDFTPQQREAITATGRSILVSAAAGSGKTAVLAARCAYLVCDAPPGERCDVSQLLVLTYTEAAAAEMRSRIVQAIRDRAAQRPHDDRLREQVALMATARVSTIHSFCLWLIRRWFSHLGVDPSAAVLDEDEARLLKRDVRDALFRDLYGTPPHDDPLGSDRLTEPARDDDGVPPAYTTPEFDDFLRDDGAMRRAFKTLVDEYGLGEDRDIGRFVMRLVEFAGSLPDPRRWLREAVDALGTHPARVVARCAVELATELSWQIEHTERIAEIIESGDPVGRVYGEQVRAYVEQLRTWAKLLRGRRTGASTAASEPSATDAGPHGGSAAEDVARFETLRQVIACHEFPKVRAPRLPKDTDPAVRAARDAASGRLKAIKNKGGLFDKRLRARFGLFSVEECVADLKRTAPHAAAIAALVIRFREAYALRKRELNVMDFADLERFALDLLCQDGGIDKPTDIARSLHDRYAYVLVDEFQDINPIQQAIVRLASRECDPAHPNNLFVVGDVKQSIYRFRLAEPAVFTERLHRFREVSSGDSAITLQRNFRSRPEILDAVNAVFRRLMPEGVGQIVYDADAELRPGRTIEEGAPRRSIELHLLERAWTGDGSAAGSENGDAPEDADSAGEEASGDEALEYGSSAAGDPSRWTSIEREAHLIGLRLREWMTGGETVDDRPMRFSDVAVLLRAKRINAERMAAMLTAMGVPAYADVGGSLTAAREVRDVLSVLRLFDNFQQDIPLAAVLRGGILSEPFTPDELLEIRCLDRGISFHEVVRRYAGDGADTPLRARLVGFLARVARYRADARRRPLADLLWMLYEKRACLAYASGLPNGSQRRANLLKLHELTRRFGSFRRQGLRRFLAFIESLEDDERELSIAPALGEADDVVRIMSIHQSKGLEFPIVFVANLGAKLNLGDRSGRMIFERESGIGLRVVDSQRMIEYPSMAHRRVASEIERTTREEELRVLYVAMTRARDRLVLVGSQPNAARHLAIDGAARQPLTALSIATAATPLSWLIPAMADAQPGFVARAGDPTDGNAPLFDLRVHTIDEMATWRVTDVSDASQQAMRSALARCAPLPPDEPLAPDSADVEAVASRIEYVYPRLSVSTVRSALAASEFKGTLDFLSNPETRSTSNDQAFDVPRSKYEPIAPGDAARRGTATHRVLQHLDLSVAVNADGVASELLRLCSAGVISPDDRSLVDAESLVWFVNAPLAQAIRDAGDAYRREFLFIATEPVDYVDRSVGAAGDDRVLVRGIVDGILPSAAGVEIVDYKTDSIGPDDVGERSEHYQPQMELYARAVGRMWRRKVTVCHLVFLSPRTIVACHPVILAETGTP